MRTRRIAIDIATTGLEPRDDHRLIEIACVELIGTRISGNGWHTYCWPDRPIDAAATAVHGLREEDVVDAPTFADVADSLLEHIYGAELILHNADLRLDFLDRELHAATGFGSGCVLIWDTLRIARHHWPQIRPTLTALAIHLGLDPSGTRRSTRENATLTAAAWAALQELREHE